MASDLHFRKEFTYTFLQIDLLSSIIKSKKTYLSQIFRTWSKPNLSYGKKIVQSTRIANFQAETYGEKRCSKCSITCKFRLIVINYFISENLKSNSISVKMKLGTFSYLEIKSFILTSQKNKLR